MAITSRKKIGLSKESAMNLMQEIYTEAVDERNRAIQTFKKFSKNTEDNTDIAMVGKITNDLLKIVDSSIEKKLKLLKIQTDIIFKTAKAGDDDEVNFKLNDDITSLIHKEIKDGMNETSVDGDNSERKYE